MKKSNCAGCSSNFYNGNNDLGVKECWHFKDAKMVWRIPVGNWERPPYKKRSIRVPNCYTESGSNKTHFIKKEALNEQGYWKF